jgi:D-3-phosphoglycerate dehydrogenase
MKKKVLITVTKFDQYCKEALDLFKENDIEVIAPCTEFPRLSEEELLKIMPDIDAVIAGLDDWNENVYKVSSKLKIIARFGLGVDNINTVKAREYGIHVTNARASFNAVSEMAVGLILSCLRKIPILDHSTKTGSWERFIGDELNAKKVGLLGFGKIPQTLAKRLSGFDVELYAYDKFPNNEIAKSLNVKMVGMDELLSICDIVSLHLPATEETQNSIDKKVFDKMKTGSYFINTARGSLLKEQDLYEALVSGKLRAAATDVFQHEPVEKDNPLLKLDNFYCTPHQGAETFQTMRDVGLIDAKAIIDVLSGKVPKNLLN